MRLPPLRAVAEDIAVAAVDLGAHYIDAKQGLNKPFENVTDIYRLGITVGGMLWYGMKGSDTGYVLFNDGLTLLTESIAYGVAKATGNKLPGAPTADPVNFVSVSPLPKKVQGQPVQVQVAPAAPSSLVNFV